MVLGMLPGTVFATGSGTPFTDVKETDWFYDAVRYVYDNGMMSGTGSATFAPNATTTRGMIVTILHRLEGIPSASGEKFTDVPAAQYYAKAVAWASANGIVSGYGNGCFGPNDPITREQLAAILYRYAQYKGCDVSVKGNIFTFADGKQVSAYAADTMNWAIGTGLISGVGHNTLSPTGSATRAQVAMILMRLCEKVVTLSGTTGNGWSSSSDNKDIVPGTGGDTDTPDDESDYYEGISDLIDTIPVEESDDVLTEAEVISFLEERGFTDFPITYLFSIDGEELEETEVSSEATAKHPMYQTFYRSENDELWSLYVINGEIYAYSVSFNLISDLSAELLVSETEEITTYVAETNCFYVTLPYATEALVLPVDTISAEVLDSLSVEAICNLTGATLPDDEDDTTSETYSLDEDEAITVQNSDENVSSVNATYSASDPLVIVSLGDSYSSGEGIEPFYGQEKGTAKVLDEDWLAHRSTLAWPARLQVRGVSDMTRKYRVGYDGVTTSSPVQWYFAAASGATTEHFNNEQPKTYRQLINDGLLSVKEISDTIPLRKQLSVFEDYNLKGKVDYVTLTIGGNDAHFTDVITSCVLHSSYFNIGFKKSVKDLIDDIWDGIDIIKDNLVEAYKDIEEAAGKQAAIIVAGYPCLFNEDGKGAAISQEEAGRVNSAVTDFNLIIYEIVDELSTGGMNIYFANVDLEFCDGTDHGAYSEKAWINPIYLGPKAEDIDCFTPASAYSMHPNKLGAIAYANCVNTVIDRIEQEKRSHKTISGVITIADTDTDMTNNIPLGGAKVEIKITDYMSKAVFSEDDGGYILTDIPSGTYQLTVSKDGYLLASETITVREDDTDVIYNITIEMIPSQYEGIGFASGRIYDAGTGLPVSNMTLYIREGLENTTGDIVSTVYMNDSTEYSTTVGLSAGYYTVQIVDERTNITEEERYITSSFNIKILGGMTIDNQNGYVSNALADSKLRIVLTWGESPSDLDSHLVGPTADGSKFHVYYSNKTYGSEADLDVDDTSSYGPETVTIHKFNEGIYTYAIHDYTNRSSTYSTAMANSGAQVKVYRGAVLLATYNVPSNKDGTLWTVFTYDSATGQFTTVNTMTYDSTPGGSLLSVTSPENGTNSTNELNEVWAVLTKDIFTNSKK